MPSNGYCRVGIIDYGLGNIFSVTQALSSVGATVVAITKSEQLTDVDKLVLPGVGSFGEGMTRLNATGMVDDLRHWVNENRPMLGICLGMQMLFENSEESPGISGLGFIKGQVSRISSNSKNVGQCRVPHVGWSQLNYSTDQPAWHGTVMKSSKVGSYAYFVHSYMVEPFESHVVLSETIYCGTRIAAVVAQKSMIGCQFHPEKSGRVGLAILNEYISMK